MIDGGENISRWRNITNIDAIRRCARIGREIIWHIWISGGVEHIVPSRFRIHSASRSSPARLSNLVSTRWHSQGQ